MVNTEPKENTTSLRWFGIASVEIFIDGKRILIDPYIQKFNKGEFAKIQKQAIEDAIRNADVILISHPHLDHFSDIKRIVELTSVPIFVSGTGFETAKKIKVPTETLNTLKHGMDISISENCTIRVYQSSHIEFDKKLKKETAKRIFLPQNFFNGVRLGLQNKKFPIKENDVFGFEITANTDKNSKSIFVIGSANLCNDINYPTESDILIFPYQGRSDLDEYSIPIIERLNPKRIILSHFDNGFPPITARIDTTNFRKRFENAEEPEFNKWIECWD